MAGKRAWFVVGTWLTATSTSPTRETPLHTAAAHAHSIIAKFTRKEQRVEQAWRT